MTGKQKNDADDIIMGSAVQWINEALRKAMGDYNSPFIKAMNAGLESRAPRVQKMVEESIDKFLAEPEAREEITSAFRHAIASKVITSFAESITDKAVNEMKANPMIRSKAILAIEAIIKDGVK